MAGGPWRVIAQRVLTGEFLTWDLPLSECTTSVELSGPGGVFGTIEPELFKVTADDGRPLLEEWSTALYVEENNAITAGGIVSKLEFDQSRQNVEAAGWSAYPVGIPYADTWIPAEYPDPVAVIRQVWTYLQSFPDAALGVTVDDVVTWMILKSGDGSFKINDYDYMDCGDIISQIVEAVPLDYVERHAWTDDTHTAISHHIDIGFPRLGTKRTDLRFAQGENVDAFSPIAADGELYANDVYGYGEGAGTMMLKSRAAVRDGRIRRAVAVPLKAANTQGYLDRRVKEQLRVRGLLYDINELTIHDHPNAPLSAIVVGDDILTEVEVPWLGVVRVWLRVLAINTSADAPTLAVLKTQRSEMFDYLAETSPTGEKVPVEI